MVATTGAGRRGAAMKGQFPRTAGQFLEHGRMVIVRCRDGHAQAIKQLNLLQRLGSEFDLYDGSLELQDTFACEECGAEQCEITFYNPDVKPFGPVTYEESTNASLERWAFARARDRAGRLRRGEEPDPPPSAKAVRYRKFGPRKP